MNARSDSGAGFTPNAAWSRKSGYVVSVVIDAILLYVVQHALDWNLPWITSAWSDAVWAMSLSLVVSIVANALLLTYDERWFHASVDLAATGVALYAGYWLYLVFPFDFGSEWNWLAHMVLLVVVFGLTVATVVTAVIALVEVLRAGWRLVTQP